jgi:gas vesicle protein GvpG
VIILDTLLIGGIKFVLSKIASAVDSQLNDDSVLREELLAAQMRLELGEITEKQFATVEADILARLREIRERQRGPDAAAGEMRITGIEARFDDGSGDADAEDAAAER